jgi:cytochrome c biogenesis protein CcmG, thiol:disulfide interchange protein DsbE
MARWRLLGWTLAALAAVVLLAVFGLASKKSPPGGRPAPALPGEQLSGAHATLASLLAGAHDRPAVVVFWASWCGPCEHEAPELERFSQSSTGRGRIVGVDWSDQLSGARSFVRRYHWSFPNDRDSEGTVGNKYELVNLPTTFVIDAHGHIRAALRGAQTQASLEAALSKVERS